MAPRAHAVLGASSSHRWMECPGSIGLSEGLENIQTEFAREGSAAHQVAEDCLKQGVDAEHFEGEMVAGYEGTEEFAPLYVTEDMYTAVQLYLDTVRNEYDEAMADWTWHGSDPDEEPELLVEERFNLSHIYPDMFGTNDALLFIPRRKKLIVYDYKHGQGIAVEVERNPQLMYYALGAITGKYHNRDIEEIELGIVQPRCMHKDGPVRRWPTTREDIEDFKDELVAAAQATEQEDAAFKAGDWCKFCPAAAAGRCAYLADFVFDMTMADFTAKGEIIMPDYTTLSPKKKAQVLINSKVIDTWLKGIKKAAHDDALRGSPPPGFRLVKSKPRRHWKSEQNVIEELEDMGFTAKRIFAPRKIKTPAQMEQYFPGKKKKKVIAHLWENRSAGISLVQDGDPRPDLRPSAEDEFGG